MDARLKFDPERRTQAERTALSDARMLDAAVSLICERGTAGMTLKEVGERAGYSRGLASYRRSVVLNSDNTNGHETIARLERRLAKRSR